MKLGVVDVDTDILQRLTAKQMTEWFAYAELEPFDETRADYRAAQIVTMIANVNRGSNQRAYEIHDFLLKFSEEARKPQTPEDQLLVAKLWAAAYSKG